MSIGTNFKNMFKRDLDFDRKWSALMRHIQQTVGKRPKDLNSVLFLIGMQELGRGAAYFSKEEKQDLSILPVAIFGVITDIQYANVDDGISYDGKRVRYYRNSLNLVHEAVNNWQAIELKYEKKLKLFLYSDLVMV